MEIPEIGQIVLVRNRPAIIRNQVTFSEGSSGIQLHTLDLEYIDGYNHPTEDRIIWEREINAKSFSSLQFPDLTKSINLPDHPLRYDSFLNALRWSSNCIFTYEYGKVKKSPIPFLSPWYSAVQIEDYQIYPVLKALEMPRVNLLLADDVGLGKTIEAGLILQELIRQRRLRRILIVCPSSLQIQWQDEMREKFNIEFIVLDSDKSYEIQRELGVDANPWTVFPKIITSMDYLKQSDILDKFIVGSKRLIPQDSSMLPWDLLIVDEAHNFTPSKFSDDSKRCSMLREVVPYFEHRMFLTATPHNGYTISFSGLMELLDPVRFQQKYVLDEEDYKHLQLVMIRRMKTELNEGRNPPRFPNRNVEAISIELPEEGEEARLFKAMREYRYHATDKMREVGKKEKNLAGFITQLLTKRLLSSSYAFAKTWWNHIAGFELEEFDYDQAYESKERAETPVEDDLEKERRELDAIRHGAAWMARFKETFIPYLDKVSSALKKLGWTKEIVGTDINKIQKMPPDRKWEELLEWIQKHLMDKKQFSKDERVIIFTEYKDTLDYLMRRFKLEKIDEPFIQILFGGSEAKHRRYVKDEFNDPLSQLRILLATDVASEGLNLQTSCRYVIHQEIPWNPMRLEQRNGRVDRHGQSRNVTVFHFVSDQIQDLEFLDFIVRKVNTVREDLGSTGAVLDEAITEYFNTGKVTKEEVDRKISGYGEYAQDKKDLKARNRGSETDYSKALKDYSETKRLLGLNEENMALLLSEAIKLEKGAIKEIEKGVYRFETVPAQWDKLVKNTILIDYKGMADAKPKVVFSPDKIEIETGGRRLFRPRKDRKLLMLGHPIMAKAISSFTRRLWTPSGESKINRWTIVEAGLPKDIPILYLFSFQVNLKNRLGERFQTGLLDLPLIFKKEKPMILPQNVWSELAPSSSTKLPDEAMKKKLPEIRANWKKVEEFVQTERQKISDSIEASIQAELSKELTQQVKDHKAMFAERRKSLELQKDPKTIEKTRKELMRAEEQMIQMTFSDEKNLEHRRKYEDLKLKLSDAEWERQHSHIELLKGRLEKEKTRVIEKVLPMRYSIDKNGIDIQPVGVRIIINKGDEN